MKRLVNSKPLRALLAAVALLGALAIPGNALAQEPVPPPDIVDWQVDRTPNGFDAYWGFAPRVHVYLNLYRRENGVDVVSRDLGTGTLRGSGVYRYSVSLSSPTVKTDEEYTLDVIAEDLSNPAPSWSPRASIN